MSRISMENVPLTTVVKGTFGYMDPEYYRRLQLTEKSDVYSFVVVLFEVINESIDLFLEGKISPSCLRNLPKLQKIVSMKIDAPSVNGVARTLEFALQLQEFEDAEEIRQANDRA
ncbi:hypothetical protein Goarm_018274 [Gossypium armourianum]|uniref:Serine-threonine/tyrosine-protein kinase catalytic domain-containing protein n=2 Tax=Gossypium TaxID=3633 RepID=A0A7J9IH27_9ROSI|nr:hypothetical protein [Gossypium armourianum]